MSAARISEAELEKPAAYMQFPDKPVYQLGCEVDDRVNPGSIPDWGRHLFLFYSIKTGSGAPYITDTGDSSPGVKVLRREADHSYSSRAEIKNTWSYIPLPHTLL